MTTHISKGTCSEVDPPSPVCRNINRIEIAHGCGPQPQIPIYFTGYVKLSSWRGNALRPNRPVSPNVHGVHIANHTILDPGFYYSCIISTTALVSHLGNYFIFFC